MPTDEPGHSTGCGSPAGGGENPTTHSPKKHRATYPSLATQLVALQPGPPVDALADRTRAPAWSEMVCSTDSTSSTALYSVSLPRLPTLSARVSSRPSATAVALSLDAARSSPSTRITRDYPSAPYSDSTVAPSWSRTLTLRTTACATPAEEAKASRADSLGLTTTPASSGDCVNPL